MTGGTGFFGKSILRARLASNNDSANIVHMTVLSRNPARFLKQHTEFANLSWLDFVQGDILQVDTLPYANQYTHIIHAAADSTIGPQLTPIERYDQIVSGTRNILDYAVKTKVERLLFTSSGGVYGKLSPEMWQVDETYAGVSNHLNSDNVYSVAKREAEHLCALYANEYGLEYVIVRCFSFVGQDLPIDVHFAIGNFIRDALFKEAIVVNGDGSPMRSYMAQEDLALWITTLLQRGRTENIYNVGSDEAVSIKDLAYLVRDIIAPEKPVHILGNGSDHLRNYYVPDISKAKQSLDLKIIIPLEKAVLQAAHIIESQYEKTYHL